jgi:ssDNA-binding Zn-finger/Zn-ribbon topoisomerase 1
LKSPLPPTCPDCGKVMKRKTAAGRRLFYECENPNCLVIKVRIASGTNFKGKEKVVRAVAL